MVGLEVSLLSGMPASARICATLFGVGAVEADDDRRPQVDSAERLDDALRHFLAAGDAAEDVDEDALHVLVEVDDLERRGHHVGVGAAADVEEVGGRATDLVDHVERAHRQAGAVGDDADGAVETDVLQVVLAGQLLALVELLGGAELVPLGMAERGVVVQADLGVEGVHAAVRAEDERVDLGQVAVALGEAAVQLHEHVGHTVDGFGVDLGATAASRAVASGEAVDRVDVQHHDGVGVRSRRPSRSPRRPRR